MITAKIKCRNARQNAVPSFPAGQGIFADAKLQAAPRTHSS